MNQPICAALAALLLAGCASDPAPIAQLQLTEKALEQARAVGAPGAADALNQAETGLAGARQAFERQEYRQARMLAERAELDARLVEAQSLTTSNRVHIDEVKARIASLRAQLEAQP